MIDDKFSFDIETESKGCKKFEDIFNWLVEIFSVWNCHAHFYESDIAPLRAETSVTEYKIFSNIRGEAVMEDFNNLHASLSLDPEKLEWYLTSSKNIQIFVQVRGLFVRNIDIKKGHPKGGKNTHIIWAQGVLNKLLAEIELEFERIRVDAAVRFGENQYYFRENNHSSREL